MGKLYSADRPGISRWCLTAVWPLVAFVLISCGGCNALNPAFVDLIAPGTANTFVTLDPAPGHIVIAFVNNAEVDEQLISYLEGPGGLVLTDRERQSLRPRFRARVAVTFINGAQTTFEFVDGTRDLIDQRFALQAETDLNQNDLDNAVVLCQVARVELLQNTLEVFIPTQLEEWDLVEISTVGNVTTSEFRVRSQVPPQFRLLQPDVVDADGNTLVRRNIDIRGVPAPIINPICGTVVTITMNGTLAVPFLTGPGVVGNNPSFDRADAQISGSVGGQFEFIVSSL